MSPIDEFLQAVERNLRGPARNRPEVLEELRGHLTDRIEALVRQEYEPEAAEAQAMEEMGPAWLLAVRLSLANGWNLFPEILRELGALGFGVVATGLAAFQLSWIERMVSQPENLLPQNFNLQQLAGSWVMIALLASHLMILLALALFAFYLTRLRQNWLWAIIPALLLFIAFPIDQAKFGFYQVMGAVFSLAVALGMTKPSPRRLWPLGVSVGLILLSAFGPDLAINLTVCHLPFSLKMVTNYFYWSPVYAADFRGFLGASCFFWLAAWILERVHTPSISKASE